MKTLLEDEKQKANGRLKTIAETADEHTKKDLEADNEKQKALSSDKIAQAKAKQEKELSYASP